MISLTEASTRALRSLATPGILVIIVYTILATIFCLTGFVAVVTWAVFHFAPAIHTHWIAALVRWGGSIGAAIFAWMLFPGIMPLIVSFFDDKIADAINSRDYPHIPPGTPPGFRSELLHDLGFSLKAIALNILCLPLYLVPVINLGVFYVVNGYLLGGEFFLMAAKRYMPAEDASRLRRAHSFTIFAGGVLLTLLATVPVANLVAPFWGVALATHLFHQAYDEYAVRRLPGE